MRYWGYLIYCFREKVNNWVKILLLEKKYE